MHVLCTAGLLKEPNEPVIEHQVEIAGNTYTALDSPQPIRNQWRWDDDQDVAKLYCVVLADLGNGGFASDHQCPHHLLESLLAKWAGRETDYKISTPIALRAPEVILQSGYDTKIDIWAVGCMVCGSWPCRD